jgi:hypothetical protein
MVSRTALSAVGAAFSTGAAAVCAPALELNPKTPASAAAAISEPIARPIAISFFECLTPPHIIAPSEPRRPVHILQKGMRPDAIQVFGSADVNHVASGFRPRRDGMMPAGRP